MAGYPECRRRVLLAVSVVAVLLLVYAGEGRAQRGGRRGGEDRVEPYPERGEGYERAEERPERVESNRGWEQGGDGGDTDTDRRGDAVDAGEATDGGRDTTRTEDGDVPRGAAAADRDAVDRDAVDRDAAADAAVRDAEPVADRGATADGDAVNRAAVDCDRGDCTRGVVGSDAPAGVAAPYFVPYASYPCPGGANMFPSASGDIIYSCGVTPVISATVPLSGTAANGGGASSAQISSSPVVMYQVSPDVVVYVTSYGPQGIYASNVDGRFYWVPGAATASQEITDAINAAAAMEQPTANATVVTYAIGGTRIYLTDQAPARGIYTESADRLHAWIPGVTQPTDAQRAVIGTSLEAHRQRGATALADAVNRTRVDAR